MLNTSLLISLNFKTMRKFNFLPKAILGIAMLCSLFIFMSSTTTTDITIDNANIYTNNVSFFDECDLEDIDLSAASYTCGGWYRYRRVNCGCAPNSPGNSSPTYSFHRDYYKRTCWTNTAPVAYWTQFSPGVCNSVCQ